MTLTSGEFDSSLFALANGADFEADATHKTPHVVVEFVDSAGTITLSDKPSVDDIHINDMTVAATGTAGDELVIYTAGSGVLKFADTYKGAEVEITYFTVDNDAVTLSVSNDKSAVAEATLVWPRHKWAA